MLNLLVSEVSGVLELLERHHLVKHVSVSAAILESPSEPVSEVILSLLSILEEYRQRLDHILSEQSRQVVHQYSPETAEHRATLHTDWQLHQIPTKDEYFGRPTPLTFAKPEAIPQETQEVTTYSYNENTNPECLEALNLSVAASPECLEAMNLSVATSPCYNPIYEAPHSKTFKNFQDVGTSSGFWDVSLDVEPTADCFQQENTSVNASQTEGFNIDFPHDIDTTSALGDGYILDISSNVNVSVTDALNASIYFELHRDGPDIGHRDYTDDGVELTVGVDQPHHGGAALDLSHPGSSSILPLHGPETYPQPLSVNQQTFLQHDELAEKYSCSTCGKILQSEKSLRRHELAHEEGDLICDHCGRGFHAYWMLKRHVLAHLSTHVCKICGKRSIDDSKLRRHEATHFSPNLMCTLCRKEFYRADNLNRHISIVHNHIKEFNCQFCHMSFSVKCNLDSHLQTAHKMAEGQIKCETCGKTYKNQATYKVHAKTHGPPRYFCDCCGMGFYRLPLYRRHLKNVHDLESTS